MKCRHHVGHLYTSVVDVILHFHRAPVRAKHPHKRVAQNRIAQVTDMRRFVGIDIGVLDDDLARILWERFPSAAQHAQAISAAIEADIDVSVAGHFKRGHAFQRPKRGDNFRGNSFGRFFQLPRQMECNRDCQFTEARLLGLFERNRSVSPKLGTNQLGHAVRNFLFNEVKH